MNNIVNVRVHFHHPAYYTGLIKLHVNGNDQKLSLKLIKFRKTRNVKISINFILKEMKIYEK
ncbi:MAG TPA: hypothetical protein DCS12_00390 [Clostridiales bacterium]|nr:hypothetical protein [Clostridiales bacterium]